MTNPDHTCNKCDTPLIHLTNSTLFFCPKCRKESNKAKMKVVDMAERKKATGKGKLNFYSTKAWINCSHYVLTYYANNEGVVKCSTSDKQMHVTDKNCHCGHYIKVHDMSKTNYSVAFDFANLAPQSYQENIYRGGNQLKMREFLIKHHGLKAIEELEIRQHNVCKLDTISLTYWADYYSNGLELLLRERGIKDHWKSK
jgi:hypothetical protein